MRSSRLPWNDNTLVRFLLETWELIVAAIIAIGAIFARREARRYRVKELGQNMERMDRRLQHIESRLSEERNAQQAEDVLNAVDRKEMEAVKRDIHTMQGQLSDIHRVVVAQNNRSGK